MEDLSNKEIILGTVIKKLTLESGQEVYEATCPADPNIKPRLPVKEVKQDEAKVDTVIAIEENSETVS